MAQQLVAIVGAYKQPRKEELRMTKGKKLAGMAIAASAALLFIGGCANTGTGGASEAQIMCEGANGWANGPDQTVQRRGRTSHDLIHTSCLHVVYPQIRFRADRV